MNDKDRGRRYPSMSFPELYRSVADLEMWKAKELSRERNTP